MKFKKIFILSLAALMTGCTGDNAFCTYEYLQARATDAYFAQLKGQLDMVIEGTYEVKSEYKTDDGFENTTLTDEFVINTKSNCAYYKHTYATKVESKSNPSWNQDLTATEEYYLAYEKDEGIVCYYISEDTKTRDLLFSNSSIYNFALYSQTDSHLLMYYGALNFENSASYFLLYGIENFCSTSGFLSGNLYEVMSNYSLNEFIGSNGEIVKNEINVKANSNKFSFNIVVNNTYTLEEGENGLRGTWTTTYADKVNGILVEESICSESGTGAYVSGGISTEFEDNQIRTLKCKNIKNYTLPELEGFED